METIAIREGLQLLGDDCWLYANSEGYFSRKLKTAWEEVITITDLHHLSYQTFCLNLLHYLKFGETPSATKKREKGRRQSVKDKCCTSSFTDGESKTLLKIIRDKPQLFLDEIQITMLRRCHKKWHYTTIWRQMKRLGYSLKVAVFVARQRNEAERERYKAGLASAVGANPKQLIYIDETHKSANASWR
jgi:hypothetical protein